MFYNGKCFTADMDLCIHDKYWFREPQQLHAHKEVIGHTMPTFSIHEVFYSYCHLLHPFFPYSAILGIVVKEVTHCLSAMLLCNHGRIYGLYEINAWSANCRVTDLRALSPLIYIMISHWHIIIASHRTPNAYSLRKIKETKNGMLRWLFVFALSETCYIKRNVPHTP